MSDPLVPASPYTSSDPISAQDGDQYREYLIPACSLSDEQDLLRTYKQPRLSDALRGIYADFYLLIELMQGYATQNDDEEYTYFLLAEKLRQPLAQLSKACSALEDWKLISRKTVGAQA